MDQNLLETAVNMTLLFLKKQKECTMSTIDKSLSGVLSLLEIGSDEYDDYYGKARAQIEQLVNIKVSESGYVVAKNIKRWLNEARKQQIEWKSWKRYELWLQMMGYAPSSIANIDSDTDKILTLMGDPQAGENFVSRGLVIGDVQSGKTGTYTALISKAADAGYKIIIVIAGVLNTLRAQTQDRLERDFVGKTTCGAIIDEKGKTTYGIGELSGLNIEHNIVPLTNVASDKVNPTYVPNENDICLLVIKKNINVLTRVKNMLERIYNEDARSKLPVLLIDDEADNASVNTKILGVEPAAINAKIVSLIFSFSKISYVGFTATPYANIFINPDTTNDVSIQAQDLFPRDYIYCLGTPSNYVGARKLFENDDFESSSNIITIDSEDEFMECMRNESFRKCSLPDSLYTALLSFIIARIIRDLRKQDKQHCSMLIHIYHKRRAHTYITRGVSKLFEKIKASIRNNIALENPELHSYEVKRLKQTWDDIYASSRIPETWEQIVGKLRTDSEYLDKFIIFKVNSDRDKELDYRRFPDGLTAIVIGGNGIARGLTLEGLTTSYFLRRSTQYDSLMQMGRWFGYRPGYEDVCRLFIPQEYQNYFAEISRATEELKDTIRRMHALRMTPMEFGLRVRNDASGLLVTARNKMRSTTPYDETISFCNCIKETFKVSNEQEVLDQNIRVFKDFLAHLNKKYNLRQPTNQERQKCKYLWENVRASEVCDFLQSCKNMHCASDEASSYGLQGSIIEELSNISGATSTVDVAFVVSVQPSEDSVPYEIDGLGRVHLPTRNPGMNPHKISNHIVFNQQRVFDADDEMGNQTVAYLTEMKKNGAKLSKETIYRSAPGRRHLVLLSFVRIPETALYEKNSTKKLIRADKIPANMFTKIVPVYAISFPSVANETPQKRKWICNVIAARELYDADVDD